MSSSTNGDGCISPSTHPPPPPALPVSATWVLEGKLAAGRAWPCVAECLAGAAGPGSQTRSWGCIRLGRTRAESGPVEGPREKASASHGWGRGAPH